MNDILLQIITFSSMFVIFFLILKFILYKKRFKKWQDTYFCECCDSPIWEFGDCKNPEQIQAD